MYAHHLPACHHLVEIAPLADVQAQDQQILALLKPSHLLQTHSDYGGCIPTSQDSLDNSDQETHLPP